MIQLDDDLIAGLDAYAQEDRRTRTAAANILIRRGLAAVKLPETPAFGED